MDGSTPAREATARTPLVPLRVFRSRAVSGANAIQALTVAGMFGMFFLGVLYLQRVLGYDALRLANHLVVGERVDIRFAHAVRAQHDTCPIRDRVIPKV